MSSGKAIIGRREIRQRRTAVRHTDIGYGQIIQRLNTTDGNRAALDCIRYKLMTIKILPLHSDKNPTTLHLARVLGDASNGRIWQAR